MIAQFNLSFPGYESFDSINTKNRFVSESESIKEAFNQELDRLAPPHYVYKLHHNGVTTWKDFEGRSRKMSMNSLMNLNNYQLDGFNEMMLPGAYDSCLGYKPIQQLKDGAYSKTQCKLIKRYTGKLMYYSSERKFTSKRSGNYRFKVAFLTLTAPESTSIPQFLAAFEKFLDYLRRTANCVYVWKKEMGKANDNLHVHLMINNFIPYYIVDWKWKRLLISEGVIWPLNDKGQHTSSHYRIELPKNSKQTGAYIAKYMSKEFIPDESIGRIWGKSKALDDCQELKLIEGDIDKGELFKLFSTNKTIGTDYVTLCICDLMKVQKYAPSIFSYFEKQFYEFQNILTLPQRFQYV